MCACASELEIVQIVVSRAQFLPQDGQGSRGGSGAIAMCLGSPFKVFFKKFFLGIHKRFPCSVSL